MTHLRKLMLEELQRRNYSQTTVIGFIKTVADFAKHFPRAPDQLGPDDLSVSAVSTPGAEAGRANGWEPHGCIALFLLQDTFPISSQWLQTLSKDKVPVPIQGPGGQPGAIVNLRSPAGTGALKYGMVKPVTQLRSSQLAANQLARNADGSLTLWFGPTLPAGAPASNWIPTPSTGYYSTLYSTTVSTAIQLTLRIYYPTPGTSRPRSCRALKRARWRCQKVIYRQP